MNAKRNIMVDIGCMKICTAVVLSFVSVFAAPKAGQAGSGQDLDWEGTGFFRLQKDSKGHWWGVRPEGGRMLPKGVVHVNISPRQLCLRKYGSELGWAMNVFDRLSSWGFNIIDCDSDFDILRSSGLLEKRGFGYCMALYMHRTMLERGLNDPDYAITPCGTTCGCYFPNVFHPKFEELCDEYAKKVVLPHRNERDLFGYYIANELAWWGRAEVDSGTGLVAYIHEKLPTTHSARREYERFAAERNLDPGAENTRLEFFAVIADRYFRVQCAAIRKYDPNHLILGCRFAGLNHLIALRAAAKYCDAVSVNMYAWADLAKNELQVNRRSFVEVFESLYAECGKPFYISEWSFVSNDRGHGSRHGAGERFRTQRERAEAVALFLKTVYAMPGMLGASYFRYWDSVKNGVNDGKQYVEDCAYGLVDETDIPYPEVTETFSRINNGISRVRAEGVPEPRKIYDSGVRSAGQLRKEMMWGASGVNFRRTGNAFTIRNADGLFLSGAIGRGFLVKDAAIGETSFTKVTGMIQLRANRAADWRWVCADVVEDVEWIESESALKATASWTDNNGTAVRMTFKVSVPARGHEFMFECLDLINVGTCAYDVREIYICPYPSFAALPDESVGLVCGYGARKEAGWVEKDGGRRVCGWTKSAQADQVRFYFFPNSTEPHPDAMFAPIGGDFNLKPGDRRAFDREQIYLIIGLSK